jgi:fructose-bisphosphate aldolase, class II
MTVATLSPVLKRAVEEGRAVAGVVVLGWEDARSYVRAAEEADIPVILQAGPACRRNTPVPVLGKMFRALAECAAVPVVCHIDHALTLQECVEGIDSGFTSVMIDGSKLPLAENIAVTRGVVDAARAAGVSVEGEVGVVGYANGAPSQPTAPDDAGRFERETGVDALAVSVGNVHLLSEKTSSIDLDALSAIRAQTNIPLVLHGGSGISAATRRTLARNYRVAKLNIGTELRMAFGDALRDYLARHPQSFDRIEIFSAIEPTLKQEATIVLKTLWGPPGQRVESTDRR